METMKFKTTIKCSGCIATATPYLNSVAGEDSWEVDVQNADKILSVITDDAISEEEVIKAVNRAGYKAERIN